MASSWLVRIIALLVVLAGALWFGWSKFQQGELGYRGKVELQLHHLDDQSPATIKSIADEFLSQHQEQLDPVRYEIAEEAPGRLRFVTLRDTAQEATAAADRAGELFVRFREEQEAKKSAETLAKLQAESELQEKKVGEARAHLLELMKKNDLE